MRNTHFRLLSRLPFASLFISIIFAGGVTSVAAQALKSLELDGYKVDWEIVTAKTIFPLGSSGGSGGTSLDFRGQLTVPKDRKIAAMVLQINRVFDGSGQSLRQKVNIWSGRSEYPAQPTQYPPPGTARSSSSGKRQIYSVIRNLKHLPSSLKQITGVMNILEVDETKEVVLELGPSKAIEIAPGVMFEVVSIGAPKGGGRGLELRYSATGVGVRNLAEQGEWPFLWFYELQDADGKRMQGSASASEKGLIRFYPYGSSTKPAKVRLIFALAAKHKKLPFELNDLKLRGGEDTTVTVKMPTDEALKASQKIQWSTLTLVSQLNARTGEITYPVQLSGQMPLKVEDGVLGVGQPKIQGLIRKDGKAIGLDLPKGVNRRFSSAGFNAPRADSKGNLYPVQFYSNDIDLTGFPNDIVKVVGVIQIAKAGGTKVYETKSFEEGEKISITKDLYLKIGSVTVSGTRVRMSFEFQMMGSPFRLGDGPVYFSKLEMVDKAGKAYKSSGQSYGHSKIPGGLVKGSGSTSFTIRAGVKPAKLKVTVISPVKKVNVPFVIDLN